MSEEILIFIAGVAEYPCFHNVNAAFLSYVFLIFHYDYL
jgi:hypothetical protein